MTKQITIKLNEERFKPLLDKIMGITGLEKTYSEVAAKCIWFTHRFSFQKDPKTGKTMLELMADMKGRTVEEALLDGLKKYSDFCQKNR